MAEITNNQGASIPSPEGEVEGLVDASNRLVARLRFLSSCQRSATGEHSSSSQVMEDAASTITALLSRMSPSPVGNASGRDTDGDLDKLSRKATQGEWTVRENGDCLTIVGPDDMDVDGDTGGWLYSPSKTVVSFGDDAEAPDEDAAFIVALVNAYRAGRLVQAPPPTPSLQTQGAIDQSPPDRREEGSRGDEAFRKWRFRRQEAAEDAFLAHDLAPLRQRIGAALDAADAVPAPLSASWRPADDANRSGEAPQITPKRRLPLREA